MLRQEFDQSGFDSVFHGGQSGAVSITDADHMLSTIYDEADGQRFRALLEDAHVYGVMKLSDATKFQLISEIKSGRRYLIEYYYMPDRQNVEECHPDLAKLDDGECSIGLDANWWLDYRWYSETL